MTTWIFQATPDDFKIDEFIASKPSECLWRVSRYEKEIAVGDTVFLWRAKGKAIAESAIFGRAKVIEAASVQKPGSAQRYYWTKVPDRDSREPRVLLGDVELLEPKQFITKNSLSGDPLAGSLSILRMARGTNFRTTGEEATRLDRLWQYIEQPWSRSDLIAVLQAFEESGRPENGHLTDGALRAVATVVGRTVSRINAKVSVFARFEHGLTPADLIGMPLERTVWAEERKMDLRAVA